MAENMNGQHSERLLKLCDLLEMAKSLEEEEDENNFVTRVRQLLKDFDGLKQEYNVSEEKPQSVLVAFEILETAISSLKTIIEKVNITDHFSLDSYRKHLMENVIGVEKPNWDLLLVPAGKIFKSSLSLRSLNPPPILEPAKEPTPKPQRKRATDDTESQLTQPIRITDENREKEGGVNRPAHVLNALKTEYKRNGKKFVPYLEFVLDPNSFSKTVSNIFTLSLLVKDNLVHMETDENNTLLVKPITSKNKKQDEPQQKNHLIVSFNYGTWQNLIKGLSLRDATIPPL